MTQSMRWCRLVPRKPVRAAGRQCSCWAADGRGPRCFTTCCCRPGILPCTGLSRTRFNLLEPRFGDLSVARNKRRLLEAWCESRLFTLSGLDKQEITAKVMSECSNGGDFLRIMMSEMSVKQGVGRWADTTPEHILYLRRIKETIPDALIIHIIRDGRDVALSTDKLGYIRRLPWDRKPSKMAAGLYWEWMVNKGRRDGRDLGDDYTEVHFEELISQPRETLARLGQFIEQDLDYDQIQRVGIGSVSAPNTSFASESEESFNPVGRWQNGYSAGELAMFEGLVGRTLEENGYALGSKGGDRKIATGEVPICG